MALASIGGRLQLRRAIRTAAEITAARDNDAWVPKRVCRFCHQPIQGREYPITLAGGERIIGYICWPCLKRAAEEMAA